MTRWCRDCRGPALPRRTFMLGLGSGVALVAGCVGDDEENEPIDLGDGLTCDGCGMVIEEHFGPAIQAYYEGGFDDRDGPARFDSVVEFLTFDADVSWRRNETFATDYSAVDVELEEQSGTTYIPSVVGADTFAPVDELVYLVDSEVEGAMGPDALPHSEPDDAEALRATFGGEIVEWDELPESISR